ncbi:PE-PPE domain-containing protein [Mycolicibacterium sp. P1-18]|uniref:PE-PPE domain-containing protein n=1 Tax=Mycolicibacterium sp. P1-18 TaxID=2024615 RepID=UPI001567394F|nr:PE-PPE domain-containing protein [Mycolicibacterium sp. P1-18]
MATFVAVPGVAIAAPTTFTLGGTAQMTDNGLPVPPVNLSGVLGGKYDDGPAVSVPFPATVVGMDQSVALGADRLVAQIQSTSGERRALGISQGAIAVAEAKRRLMGLPVDQRPDPYTLTFVAIADPTRPGHGALTQMGYQTPDTPYDTIYFTREYDGLADLPDRFNVLALVNAAAGIVYIHPYYGDLPADLPAKNVTTTVNGSGATITDVLIPTRHLPMLQPLRDLGMNVDGLEAALKPMVDAGYSRNDVRSEPVAVTNTVVREPKKPHRNVQASDATHELAAKSTKVDDEKDEPSGSTTPAPTPTAAPDEPAATPDDPTDASDSDSDSDSEG